MNFLDKKSCQHLDCLSIKIPNTYCIHRNDILITIHPCPTCDCDPPFTRLDCQNCGTNIQCKTSYTTSTIICVQRRSCWKLPPSPPLGPRLDHRTHTKLCHPASRQRQHCGLRTRSSESCAPIILWCISAQSQSHVLR